MSRYIEVTRDIDVDIDLHEIIPDIVDLAQTDETFRENIMNDLYFDSEVSTDGEALDILKNIRKNYILWDRIKPEIEKMLKEDYVVVL